MPPGFAVSTTLRGRLLHTSRGFSVYAFDDDTATRSGCDAACEQLFVPMQAPAAARAHGEWALFTRESGERQWMFRGKPLYHYAADARVRSLAGSDVPGWRNVYTQETPPPPAEFTVQDTPSGQVLADARGRTVYSYTCGDDAPDQLSCELPADTQVYRLAMCGGGSAERCARNFPYVAAAPGARSQEPAVERGRDRSRNRPSRGRGKPGRAPRLGLPRAPGLHFCRGRAAGRGQCGRAGRVPVGPRGFPGILVAR